MHSVPQEIPRSLPAEVLEKIFIHLSSRSLRRRVRLVCKQWYLVSQWFIVQNLVWDDCKSATLARNVFFLDARARYPEEVLSGLFNESSKVSQTRLYWSSTGNMTTWYQLVCALARLNFQYKAYQAQQQQVNVANSTKGARRRLINPLMELSLAGDCNFNYRFNQIAGYLLPLYSLELNLQNRLKVNLDVDSILFKSCPNLRKLHIQGGARPVCLNASQTDSDSSIIERLSNNRLQLQSLVLHNVFLSQPALEYYLAVSPNLQELRLVGIDLCNRYRRDWRKRLIQHIQNCEFAPHLTTFQLSYKGSGNDSPRSLTFDDIQALFDFEIPAAISELEYFQPIRSSKRTSRLQNVTHWGFSIADLSPASFRGNLFNVRNVVTALTLTHGWHVEDHRVPGSGLHDFLCASPHLLHLYAQPVIFRVESMDPYAPEHFQTVVGEMNLTDWSHRPVVDDSLASEARGIWACRRLRTLHATFTDQRRFEHRAKHSDMQQTHSRVIFGYLSKVCPQLEELHLTLAPVDLGLQSGLCLLSRLKSLERLEISMSAPVRFWSRDERHWDWIARHKSYWQVVRTQVELLLLDSHIQEEEWSLKEKGMEIEEEQSRVRLEAELGASTVGSTQDRTVEQLSRLHMSSIDSQDKQNSRLTWEDLSEVSKLRDVKQALEELYEDWKKPCWPLLEDFRVFGSKGPMYHVQAAIDKFLNH
ncbi:hypothetical protein BG004_003937 [Podila humilis]|nr:hypothetical protein BG004_003937 [Podila humilis]